MFMRITQKAVCCLSSYEELQMRDFISKYIAFTKRRNDPDA